MERERVLRLEPEWDLLEPPEALRHERGPHEQHEGQRDLRSH